MDALKRTTEWADWLVQLDEDGMTAVLTPHSVRIWNKNVRKRFLPYKKLRTAGGAQQDGWITMTDNLTTEECAAGFTPQRGTGQGDVISPACSAAVFAILLELDV